ncbi:MAG: hypothetical protein QMD08_01895 [Actinomycetota bacterium]|nr:hypothetical protein [Actinomycetota bacterium]
MDERIFLTKPDSLSDVERLISPSLRRQAEAVGGLAIGEIAGRDSIAAIIKAAERDDIDAVLPTIVYTGTEYGDWDLLGENIEYLRQSLEGKFGRPIFDAIVLGDPVLWHALNGRFLSVLLEKFGFYSPCLGCHLYMHLVRVPLAKKLDCTKIVGGEREAHEGRLKINQVPMALDAYIEVLSCAGIELILPIRKIDSNEKIKAIVGPDWEQGERQLKCVFSGNYRTLDGSIAYDEDALRRYFDEFAIPAGKEILKAWQKGAEVNYVKLVGEILREK